MARLKGSLATSLVSLIQSLISNPNLEKNAPHLTDSNQYFVGNEYVISLQDACTDR